MTQFKTVVIEDEGPARRRLEKMVRNHEALELVSSAKSATEAKIVILKYEPDLLLLDIQLKDSNAFELLNELGNNITSKIIFITAYDQYAIKAFEIEAIDYLLKPYSEERFKSAIYRVSQRQGQISNKQLIDALKKHDILNDDKIIISEGNKRYYFSKDEIRYIKSDKFYVNIYTNDTKTLIRITLKKLNSILPTNFIRINKSTILNSKHVSKVEFQKKISKILLNKNEEFFASKTYYNNLEKLLFNK